MRFNRTLSLLLASTFVVFFFNVTIAEASVIIRPPNNLGLVGYWSFDEGRGAQASDVSGNGHNGTLSGSTPPAWVTGRAKQALSFNTTGGVKNVLIPSFVPITSTFTMSAWVYPTNYPSERSTIMQGTNPNSYYVSLASNGSLQTYWYGKSSQGYHSSGASTVPLNKWSHVSVVWSTAGPSLYIDGVLQNSVASTGSGIAGTVVNIGAESLSRQFIGSIDEVRIYSRALSETEIQSLYTNSKSTVVGETSASYYSEGLVAHYTFDGSTVSGTTVEDVAGSNDGTVFGAVPTMGRIGQGMRFNGGSDYLQIANPINQPNLEQEWSVAAWVNLDAYDSGWWYLVEGMNLGLRLIHSTDRTLLYLNSGVNDYYIYGASPGLLSGQGWKHVVFVFRNSDGYRRIYVDGVDRSGSGPNLTSTPSGLSAVFRIGMGSKGVIDDVRIYDRALSADEVRGLAGGGFGVLNTSTDDLLRNGLVGFWTFDSNTVFGNTVQDLSSYGNNGTIVGGASSAMGKIEQAMEFDGVDDYIDITDDVSLDITGDLTISSWVFLKQNNNLWAGGGFLRKRAGINANYQVRVGATTLGWWTNSDGAESSSSYSSIYNTWAHVSWVISGNTLSYFMNGVERGSHFIAARSANDGTLAIGWAHTTIGTEHFNGAIDDVRIYNRALSEAEITQLYSMGQ